MRDFPPNLVIRERYKNRHVATTKLRTLPTTADSTSAAFVLPTNSHILTSEVVNQRMTTESASRLSSVIAD